ncbi:MAG: ribonuclease III [Lachnospiraceae bacterium]|nr:ribonuclease III [Lachnospiraceae bacterium]
MDLAGLIREGFELKQQDIRSYSPLTLAFLGDNVFDLIIRSLVAQEGNRQVNILHRKKSAIVCASAQAAILEAVKDSLSEEEAAVVRRGRNAKSHTMPKNAKMSDYRNATGFEALLGFLYLQGRMDRILELTKTGLEAVR